MWSNTLFALSQVHSKQICSVFYRWMLASEARLCLEVDRSEWRSLTVCSGAHSPAKLLPKSVDLICTVYFYRYSYKSCYTIYEHAIASTSSITEEEIQCTIWWKLLPLIVPDIAISECTIISTGHPNGAEPLSLAVSRSVH